MWTPCAWMRSLPCSIWTMAAQEGEWIPNRYGGRENLEAIDFLRQLNEHVYASSPGVMVIAEESTSWPMVSRPIYVGGLGFGFKWNMGWMHDMLDYMSTDPVYRGYHHSLITFGLLYAFSENFLLPFSHDEVVYGKGSMIRKMPGDDWQKFANLRLLYGYMFGHPGKKLLFMGCEFGQWNEWNHDTSLDWHLLQSAPHSGLQRWVRDLNTFYRSEAALFELDTEPGGFEWIDCDDSQQSVVSFLRLEPAEGSRCYGGLQFHSRAPPELPGGRAVRRLLERRAEQRRAALRRQRPGESGRPERLRFRNTGGRIR